ncbi:MAG: ABC transporter permease [Elusimicrobiota bacterium]
MNSSFGKVLLGFLKKEFAQALRDPVMRVFIFVAPIVQMLLLGYAIDNQVKNIKLAVSYRPGDAIMRQLSEKFYSSGWFVEAGYDLFPEELVKTGRADAVLVAPRGGLTRALGREDAQIQLLVDASNATKARAIETYALYIVRGFSSEITSRPELSVPGVSLDVRLLYNPEGKTSLFMVPGIMTMLLCIVTIMLTGMSLAREKEMGTFETIIAAPLKNIEIILGKTLPYIILGMIDAVLVVIAGRIMFDVPIRGPLIILALAAFIFICTTVSIGMLISTFSKNQQQAMLGTFIFLLPANLLSGLFFPLENMPAVIRSVAYLDPLMYFIKILRNVMLKGANPGMVWTDMGILALFGICVIILTLSRFRQTLN